jgi:exonuclease III
MEQNFKSADLSVSYQLGDDAGDLEGRLITVEGENFSLTNVYVPNSGDGMFVIYLVFLYLLFKCEICVCRTKTIRI